MNDRTFFNRRRWSAVLVAAVLTVPLVARAAAADTAPPKIEIRGAAILSHPCGKVAVKNMGLVHAGKFDEAMKLGTPEMQTKWKALPEKDRAMMSEMMKETSETAAEFSAAVKAGGLLVVEGSQATLTVKQEHKDANGTGTKTMTQFFALDGTTCRITHKDQG
jgi:hypothetical protein